MLIADFVNDNKYCYYKICDNKIIVQYTQKICYEIKYKCKINYTSCTLAAFSLACCNSFWKLVLRASVCSCSCSSDSRSSLASVTSLGSILLSPILTNSVDKLSTMKTSK